MPPCVGSPSRNRTSSGVLGGVALGAGLGLAGGDGGDHCGGAVTVDLVSVIEAMCGLALAYIGIGQALVGMPLSPRPAPPWAASSSWQVLSGNAQPLVEGLHLGDAVDQLLDLSPLGLGELVPTLDRVGLW